jgi:hypothetical protein
VNHQEQVRLVFKKAAENEGISLREWCRKNGIVYSSFFGSEDEDVPGKVYLSQLDGSLRVERSKDDAEE